VGAAVLGAEAAVGGVLEAGGAAADVVAVWVDEEVADVAAAVCPGAVAGRVLGAAALGLGLAGRGLSEGLVDGVAVAMAGGVIVAVAAGADAAGGVGVAGAAPVPAGAAAGVDVGAAGDGTGDDAVGGADEGIAVGVELVETGACESAVVAAGLVAAQPATASSRQYPASISRRIYRSKSGPAGVPRGRRRVSVLIVGPRPAFFEGC
jgi:hypothetical protein